MSERYEGELAEEIDATVRSVPGVTGVFRSGSAVRKAFDAGARVIGRRNAEDQFVRLEQTSVGLRVEAAIGVRASAGVVQTSRRVQAAISALCGGSHITVAEIYVTVVHIDDTR